MPNQLVSAGIGQPNPSAHFSRVPFFIIASPLSIITSYFLCLTFLTSIDLLCCAAGWLTSCYSVTCEKQITVPDNSVLYCSERYDAFPDPLSSSLMMISTSFADSYLASCRRKDSCKPLSASLSTTASMSPSTTPPSSPPMSPRVIVAPMTPTKAPIGPTPSIRIPAKHHDAKTDLDPTEWKPVIPRRSNGSATSLASSEAWQYLSKFLGGSAETMLPSRRSGHRSTTSLSSVTSGEGAPSLSHTPSTAASSLNSNSDYVGYMHDYANRPLPPRHNPSFSTSAGTTKGVELVVPQISPPAENA